MGLYESVGDYYPEADWQRCMVHFHRNAANRVPSTKVKEVARMLKAIYAQESREAAMIKVAALGPVPRATLIPARSRAKSLAQSPQVRPGATLR